MSDTFGSGMRTEVFVQREPFFRGIRLWITERRWEPGRQTRHVAQVVNMVPTTEGQEPKETISLGDEQAQQFMDELWRVGFRPTEGTGSAGSLAATERHLKDLQRLVFKDKPKL